MQFSNVKKSIQDRADTSTNQEFEKSQMNKKEFTTKAKNVLDTRYKVEQQRDLSDDESMESEITITEEVNLWQLKQKLGLGQTKVIEEQESTSWFTPTKIIGLVVAAGVIHTAYKYLDISLSDVFDIDLTGSTCSDVSTIL
jgi:hypothetical protein